MDAVLSHVGTWNGFFYEQPADGNDGNALWTADSRHVLVLNKALDVKMVDTQTGHVSQVLTLPYWDGYTYVNRIEKLVFDRNGSLYFVGAGWGQCAGMLCRVSLTGYPHFTRSLLREKKLASISAR